MVAASDCGCERLSTLEMKGRTPHRHPLELGKQFYVKPIFSLIQGNVNPTSSTKVFMLLEKNKGTI